MPGASLALFADLGACHVQKSSVTICVLPAPSGWRATPLLPPISMRWIYFYPRPPCGGRHITSFRIVFTDPISIHALRVEGDYHWDNHRRVRPDHFYPRPPGGGRQDAYDSAVDTLADFYPRPPGGGRRKPKRRRPACRIFLSTPSGWRATGTGLLEQHSYEISIHALRVEGDLTTLCCFPQSLHFYPRPPGGGRQDLLHIKCALKPFLSTPSGWRATVANNSSIRRGRFLSTPSGWRATGAISTDNCIKFISIHALWVEGDLTSVSATVSSGSISIHALRVEGDRPSRQSPETLFYFYPRPPGGGRPLMQLISFADRLDFYPRPPGGGRLLLYTHTKYSSHFYPRPPGGGRPRRSTIKV